MTENTRSTEVEPVMQSQNNDKLLLGGSTPVIDGESEEADKIPVINSQEKDITKGIDDLTFDETLVTNEDYDENGDPIFPHDLLAKLDEMVNKPKWIIPVLPKAELELLMDATIKLAKKGWKQVNKMH